MGNIATNPSELTRFYHAVFAAGTVLNASSVAQMQVLLPPLPSAPCMCVYPSPPFLTCVHPPCSAALGAAQRGLLGGIAVRPRALQADAAGGSTPLQVLLLPPTPQVLTPPPPPLLPLGQIPLRQTRSCAAEYAAVCKCSVFTGCRFEATQVILPFPAWWYAPVAPHSGVPPPHHRRSVTPASTTARASRSSALCRSST